MPELLFFGDDGDDGFGDFKVAASSSSSSFAAPSPALPSLFPDPAPPPLPEDDDWGDFVVGSPGSHASSQNPPLPFDRFPDAAPIAAPQDAADAGKAWEKVRGAIPLSIFGEEDVEEPDTLDPPTLFGSGFSSSSLKSPAKNEIGSGADVGLKDLIANLYGQAGTVGGVGYEEAKVGSDPVDGDDGFDESSWEFKDASSPDSEVKKEEKDSEISGLDKKAAANGNGIEVVDNGSGDHWRTTGLLSVNNGEQDLSHIFSQHDGFTNGWNFDSGAVPYMDSSSDAYEQTKDVENGNGLLHNLENNEEDRWEVQDAFSRSKVETAVSGQQKNSDAEAELLATNNGTQGTILWENNIGDWPATAYTNGHKKDDNGFLCDPSYVGNEIKDSSYNSIVGFDDSILKLYKKADLENDQLPQNPRENVQSSSECLHSVSTNGNDDFDEIDWEFQKATETIVSDQNSSVQTDQLNSAELTHNIFLDLYHRLEAAALFLAVHALDDLKKAQKVAALSGDQAKAMTINGEIQEAYKKLGEAIVVEDAYIKKHPSKDVCVSQLIKVIGEPRFKALEQEYRLSEKILSAEKDLGSAVKLFEHSNSILHILQLASREEQHAYISVWSSMALVCAQELQHGAMIWAESLGANVCQQILSQGNQYFLALGEIYRASEILRASMKYYKPWFLTNQGVSCKVQACLEKCAEAWITCGLEKALKSISSATGEHAEVAKALLESIKFFRNLDEFPLRNNMLGHDRIICMISLLPMSLLQDMKTVVWAGEHYCVKLVNFWANRISPDPPQLPHIHVS
ncbi:uncharacterized protein LOC103708018 isoform X2 [Phoenix dactylifera]|uniref:Uncharacterized protein LOC103708018 isoform X2 n=1 Tax=Phoenix dactylifera TaxID=42345 RepID=A0A8B7C3K0_PHODC|nr:uncharacterized protein LOC103708018 isoform X2 [Phoenix dactylifera]